MRIGVGRLAQKSSSKHSLLRHIHSSTSFQSFVQLSKYRFGQYGRGSRVLRQPFTSTTERLDKAERKLRQQDETMQSIPARNRSRSNIPKKDAEVRRGMEALTELSSPTLKKKKKDPNTWTSRLNDFYLRTRTHLPSQLGSEPEIPLHDMHLQILSIMYEASKPYNAEVDLLTYMGIKQGNWKAVLWLTDTLLQNVSMRMLDARTSECPSNIDWASGGASLDKLTQQPFSVESLVYTNNRPIEESAALAPDPKYSDFSADNKDQTLRTMKQIWHSLGSLITEAAELPEDQSEIVMAVVYQVIAKVHALGLVPDNVYSYGTSAYSCMVPRPPILHLLSSRVLTTLSDATWRSHQMEVIEQAVSLGTPLQSLVKDLPGGRFRLKVRPLGPEVWLEFVLWCCVEGGFGSTGVHIINRLQRKTQNPWFGVPWASQTTNALSRTVDWDRVRLRHGGSVGLIEGYNREPPFVEMAPHTVSAEVVLMLVETMASSVNTGMSGRSLSMRSVVSKAIPSLVEFLEPHSLPNEYFDYVAVRLLQTGAFDVEHDPTVLERWVEKVSNLRSLKSTIGSIPASAAFEVHSITKQSEVYAGMLHQVMEAYIDQFDVRSAIAVFNRIQEFVDVSKLQSISAFLATTSFASEALSTSQGFFSARTSSNKIDFIHSHGQLPLHKLASFLNLTTESKLFRIGQWLLFSDEVDEPVIPKRLYGKSSLSTALVRFAGASGDEELLGDLIEAHKRAALLPSVSLLRSLFDSFVSNYLFREARNTLLLLRKAKGGGYSPKNVASMASSILRLESYAAGSDKTMARSKQGDACTLMREIIAGKFDGRQDTFRVETDKAFRQQVAALLAILSDTGAVEMLPLARKWQESFPLINQTTLSTDTFNIVMASIVDAKGSSAGMKVWQSFCDDLISESKGYQGIAADKVPVGDEVLVDDNDYGFSRPLMSAPHQIACGGEYLPFVESFTKTTYELAPRYDEGLLDQEQEFSAEYISFENAFPVAADPPTVRQTDSKLKGLVKPNLRTLRIIVQGALAERRAREEEGKDASSQKQVLEWSIQFYRQLETSTEIIQQEIQLSVEEPPSKLASQRIEEERKLRLKIAAVGSRASTVGHVYKQFHGWRPLFGRSKGLSKKALQHDPRHYPISVGDF